MRIAAIALLLAVTTSPAVATPPPNDHCANATVVGALPYTDVVDTLLARPAPGDENYLYCGPGDGPTVWYRFVPPATGSYCARTCGSDYDTVLGAALGSCFGADFDCDDDSCDFESAIWFDVDAGVPVLMVVGAYEFSPQAARGGHLQFSVMDASADTDGDGVYDCDDNCVDTSNVLQPDADFDGLGDECETCTGIGGNGQDSDADGYCGYVDRCPFVSNPDQADADGDYSGDVCDACSGAGGVDADLDGVCDDVGDNCPTVPNPDQLDGDADFVGDACDACPGFPGGEGPDADGDAVPDLCDVCPDDATDRCPALWGCLSTPYQSSDESLLVRVNPATGFTKTVGSLGVSECRGLAFEPGSGRLLAYARSLVEPPAFDLYSVDPETAAVTRIGKVVSELDDETSGIGGHNTSGLTFRSDGTLFASIDGFLFLIDPVTGDGTYLADGGDYPGGLAFDDVGRLLFASTYDFVELDQTTGAPTPLPNLVAPWECPYGYVDDVFGLVAANGTLYASFECYPSALLGTIDASTGIVTTVGQTPLGLTALAAEACGNGTREGAEECDDGNVDTGDCCLPTCRFEAAGTACADDGSLCTTDACDGAGACAHLVPTSSCTPAAPERASLSIVGGPDPKVTWKWRGTIPAAGDFGAPLTTTDLTVCVADGDGTLLASAVAPASGICRERPCWKTSRGGFTYRDRDRTPAGIDRLVLRSDPIPARARLTLKARGPSLALAGPSYATPVHVRLLGDGPACWSATFSTADRNDASAFKARRSD